MIQNQGQLIANMPQHSVPVSWRFLFFEVPGKNNWQADKYWNDDIHAFDHSHSNYFAFIFGRPDLLLNHVCQSLYTIYFDGIWFFVSMAQKTKFSLTSSA